MSKKRLEEIEKNLDPLGYGMGGHLISVNDIYWLVRYAKEQSGRVQELEEEVNRYQSGRNVAVITKMKMDELEQQNKRYREAIEVATHNMAASDNLGVKFALEILEQALEGEK